MCLSINLSVCLSLYIYIYRYTCKYVYIHIYTYIYICTYLSTSCCCAWAEYSLLGCLESRSRDGLAKGSNDLCPEASVDPCQASKLGTSTSSSPSQIWDIDQIPYPSRSKYPIFEVSGPNNHTLNGFWDQRPEVLGTWDPLGT